MSDKINIVIDTIGGDNGAYVCVKGALQGIKNHKDVKIFLTGHKSEIDLILGECEYNKDQIEVIDCSEEVSLNEPPVQAVREKKDSSLVVGNDSSAVRTAFRIISKSILNPDFNLKPGFCGVVYIEVLSVSREPA